MTFLDVSSAMAVIGHVERGRERSCPMLDAPRPERRQSETYATRVHARHYVIDQCGRTIREFWSPQNEW